MAYGVAAFRTRTVFVSARTFYLFEAIIHILEFFK